MHFEYARGDKVHAVELVELGEGRWRALWSLRADDAEDGELLAEESLELEVLPSGPASYSVLNGSSVHELRVERDGFHRHVVESGRATSFAYRDPYTTGAGGSDGHDGGPVDIISPMPGRVVELLVEEGARVEEGQTVVVVEAMKMANEYRAPFAGTVSVIRSAVGDAVEGGTVLMVIEPDAED